MNTLIKASKVKKYFGDHAALNGIDLDIKAGSVVGLIGPNGAGKTTLLRSLLGLYSCQGELKVLGFNPYKERSKLLAEACTITDTAVLPTWMSVHQLLDYVAGVHPKFNRNRATAFLGHTEIGLKKQVKQLSKGMVVQLHLALVMSIDARLLILDEPTLGLDILFRKQFFEQLLNDYYDDQRTIMISTHQVEEVENLLTNVVFIKSGKIVLNQTMNGIAERYVELRANGENAMAASTLPWIGQSTILGGKAYIFGENVPRQQLSTLGELTTPSLADLFVAIAGSEAKL